MSDGTLDTRWKELVGLVEDEFVRNGMDPINFQADRARLKLRAQLTFPPSVLEWFVTRLTEQEVLTGDLRQIAAYFHRDYRADLAARRSE